MVTSLVVQEAQEALGGMGTCSRSAWRPELAYTMCIAYSKMHNNKLLLGGGGIAVWHSFLHNWGTGIF